MAKYNVITNITSDTADSKAEAAEQAAALSACCNYGPDAEEAIMPSRHPSDDLASSLTVDEEWAAAEEEDADLASIVAEWKSVFGTGD